MAGYSPGMPVILIVDDHPLFRRALAGTIADSVPDAVTLEAASLALARDALQERADVDLVLLDLHMPDSRGLMGLAALRAEFPAVAVMMVSAHEDPRTVRRAMACGAMGFIPKSAPPDHLAIAVQTVLDCREWLPEQLRDAVASASTPGGDALAARLATLTAQQHRVLAQVADGRLNKQIADTLGIQERTVKAHLTAIFERLGVRNRTQAGVLLRSLDLGDPSRSLPD
jgi:DNA-binding NarL/FixJ family response regulator